MGTRVSFLAIYDGRKPLVLSGIDAPAVKTERAGLGGVGAIETHDVVIPILRPDSASEVSFVRLGPWIDIENQAPNFAQELAMDVRKFIMLAVEAIHVAVNHLTEGRRRTE